MLSAIEAKGASIGFGLGNAMRSRNLGNVFGAFQATPQNCTDDNALDAAFRTAMSFPLAKGRAGL